MKQETLDSVTSYTVGGTGMAIATLTDLANLAQSVTLILACIVVAIRLVHDAIGLYKRIKGLK